ncbi:DNA-methyltransferase [Meiothermus ruber]|uniref:DNA-methyltransferase n=1 Tax=Meiothermus ruber TaxID=277 RepID=UPI001F3DD77A|nr:site-specific DNA-methyltransferase [Meiothermus ruber]MCX7801384.1 site-specific DNA-methyltransferase [Meiothermus ruber]
MLTSSIPAYHTRLGAMYCGDALELLPQLEDQSVHLLLTSPPFALQRPKVYGNKPQVEYVDWLLEFMRIAYDKLHPSGSLVLDLGGAYEQGVPVRSLYNFRLLVRLCDDIGYFLAQDFYWHNPSKLPSPIEWVNKRKIRAKDAVNTVWWLSKNPWPQADLSQVLTPYSERMKKLLRNPEKYYQPKERPSGHQISRAFAKDNGGALPSNLLSIPNSGSNDPYQRRCKALGLKPHPARFPAQLPEFFIRLLTKPNDLVLDIFAGSNTTGFVAEGLGRRWIAFELDAHFTATSALRFLPEEASGAWQEVYKDIYAGKTKNLSYLREPLFTAG